MTDYTASSLDTLLNDIVALAPDSTRLGAAVEDVADYALLHDPVRAGLIVSIERYEDFAKREGLPVLNDLGIDRVVTTIAGDHWALQVKGHDADKTHVLDATKRVGMDAFGKLIAVAPTHIFKERYIVTTGAGVTENVKTVNAAYGYGVITLNRSWMTQATVYPNYSTMMDELEAWRAAHQPGAV